MVLTAITVFLLSVYNGPAAAVIDELGPPRFAATLQSFAMFWIHVLGNAPGRIGRRLDRRSVERGVRAPGRRRGHGHRRRAVHDRGAPAAGGDRGVTTTQQYYDRFSETYENERHRGYHRLIDELELDLVRRYGAGKDVFEAGCGTGLLLREAAAVARSRGRPGPVARACWRRRATAASSVVQGSLTDVPLPSASFDLVYSMKVLAHVQPIQRAVAELARLVRPGGHLLLEFYNPLSLRYLAKRLGGPGRIAGDGTDESHVFTRFDRLVARPLVSARRSGAGRACAGVRVVTPASHVFAWPPLGKLFAGRSASACDAPLLRNLGGFLILVARKSDGATSDDDRSSPPASARRGASSQRRERSPALLLQPVGRLALPPPPADGARPPARRRRARAGGGRRQRRAGADADGPLPRLHGNGSDAGARAARARRPRLQRASSCAPICCEEDLPANHYDAVVCFSVLEHIADSAGAARGLARVLAPGGTLVCGYPMVSALMTRAFSLIGFKGIDDHHVSPPAKISRRARRRAEAGRPRGVPARRPRPRRALPVHGLDEGQLRTSPPPAAELRRAIGGRGRRARISRLRSIHQAQRDEQPAGRGRRT